MRRTSLPPSVPRLALLALLLHAAPAWPLDPGLPVAQAQHTGWQRDAQAPANIVAMAQTPDGFLWLGTGGGLVRFDGVRFERVDPLGGHPRLSGSVTALQALPDGRLLIGHRFGGVSILGPDGLQHFHGVPGLPVGNCWDFAVDAAGDVWGAFTGGVARLKGGQWQTFALDGEPVPFRTIVRDPQGTLWVTARTGAYALAAGGTAFQRVQVDLPSFPFLSVAPGGQVWAADFARQRLVALAQQGGRFGAASGVLPLAFPAQADRHWFDADGGLWVRSGQGLLRMPRPTEGPVVAGVRQPEVQLLGPAQGLEADAQSFLEDREGNVWIGTASGLHRLRQSHVTRVPLPGGDGAVGVAPAADGGVWAISELGGLHRVAAPGQPPLQAQPLGLAGQRLTHVHRDAGGAVWVGSNSALWKIEPGRPPQRVPRPDAGDAPQGMAFAPLHALATDASGVLWAHLVVKGTFRLVQGRWQQVDNDPAARIMSLGNDPQGRLWIGYVDRGAARIDGDQVLRLGPAEGLDIGAISAVHARGARVWLGGQRGIALYEGGRIHTMPLPGEAVQPAVVTGIVETEAGELWVQSASGLMRIAAAEWRRALSEPGHAPQVRRFDADDGLQGSASQIRPLPSLVQSQDGRLWSALPSGLFVIDPARLRRNPLPPTVLMRQVVADGRALVPGAGASGQPLQLPTGGVADLRLDYTATSLGMPQRVRFRYRLEGYDADWREAGPRREAAYTKVGPGRYVFRVVAANEDGVWNERGAQLALEVPPAFWQTRSFAAALLLLALAAGVLLYRWRVRALGQRLQVQAEVRLRERERIARDLHDTLLQGVTGLTLQVQAAADEAPAGSPLQARLLHALDRAQDVMEEGRDRVSALRTTGDGPVRTSPPLGTALAAAIGELAIDFPRIHCQFRQQGPQRPVRTAVADELVLIGREAVCNALRHAQARRVLLRLRYGRHALALRISDDGQGFDAQQAEAAARAGHFGLAGMRERAAAIGARLRIHSGSRGTVVVLTVRDAYCADEHAPDPL